MGIERVCVKLLLKVKPPFRLSQLTQLAPRKRLKRLSRPVMETGWIAMLYNIILVGSKTRDIAVKSKIQ